MPTGGRATIKLNEGKYRAQWFNPRTGDFAEAGVAVAPIWTSPDTLDREDWTLSPPAGGKWYDTVPEASDASDALLASARGASPTNPVWVVPVGPGTNVASAILQARAGVIIVVTPAAMVTWGFVDQVDVTCADWQIPFVPSVGATSST